MTHGRRTGTSSTQGKKVASPVEGNSQLVQNVHQHSSRQQQRKSLQVNQPGPTRTGVTLSYYYKNSTFAFFFLNYLS